MNDWGRRMPVSSRMTSYPPYSAGQAHPIILLAIPAPLLCGIVADILRVV